MRIEKILEMDGRKPAPDPDVLKRHPRSKPPLVSGVRAFLAALEKQGRSDHSNVKLLLGYGVAYCEEKGYDFTLTCVGGRYSLQINQERGKSDDRLADALTASSPSDVASN